MQQNEEQVKTDEEIEEEAFQSRMAQINGADEKLPAQDEPKEDEVSTEHESVEQEEKQERVEVIPGYTKEEIDAALAAIPKLQSALDRTNGTYGSRLAEQQKLIEELRNQKQQQVEQVQSQVSKLSPESLKRLRAEFPELAEVLAEDLSEIIVPQSQADITTIKREYDKRFDELRQTSEKEKVEMGRQMLEWLHPDWQEVAMYNTNEQGMITSWNDPKFGYWLTTQPEDVQQEIINSDNAFKLAKHITKYKDSLKPATTNKKQTNLERAVQPQGVPSVRAPSDLDEEEAAFNARLRELHHRL
jgi:hypothetical protein